MNYKNELRKAILKYVLRYLIILPSYILVPLFPIAWCLKFLGKFNPLWIVLDDTRLDPTTPTGLSEDYRIFLNDHKIKWLGVLEWHMKRNMMWNLIMMFKVPQPIIGALGGNQRILASWKIHDNLYRKGEEGIIKVEMDGIWVTSAALKFVGKPGDDPWQVNRGEIINHDTTILGKGYMLYMDVLSGEYFFRYTSCELVQPWWAFGKVYWLTKFFGTNANRYAFKYKFQAVKPWSK